MEDARIDVEMRSRYIGNLAAELRKDQRRIDNFRRILERKPIIIPVKIDMQGALAQAKVLQGEIQKALSKQTPIILGPTGSAARSSLLTSAAGSGNLSTVIKRTPAGTFTTTSDQIAPGITRSRTTNGSGKELMVSERDISNVRRFQEALKDVSRLSAEYQRAGARNDTAGQRAVIARQIDAIGGQNGILAQAAKGGLSGSPIFDRAEARLDRLRATMARLEGREETLADRTRRDERGRTFERREKRWSRGIDSRLDANDVELTRAKAIKDQTAREAELNRVLGERRAILERNLDFFRKLDEHSQRQGNQNLADRAFRRTIGASGALDQHDKDAAKLGIDQQRKADAAAEAERKKNAAASRSARQLELERMIQDEVAATRKAVKLSQAEERQLKAGARNARERSDIAGAAAERRQTLYQGSAARLTALEATADREGFGRTGLKARAASNSAANASVDQMNRFTSATRASGHALDFHSSQLARNALTFAKWYGPMQLVLGSLRALNSGLAGMVDVDRKFATLRAVFRGTAEEAQLLKEETLQLATVNARSAEEAMDASIRFSRLGMTRVQVLKATETALMAANVAEVDAAYAAEKLSAIYASYKLTVDDLPVVLNRLNAISNRYNVTNKDMLEGISRVAAVARGVKLELRDLEGIIAAAVGATGRPGQEIGTALRYVITNTARPETIKQLKESFNFDMTRPTGDMKSYLEILQDLAALYPTLNSYEQKRLLDITAGSRHASKFAEILGNFNQAQALTIEAALDTNSAFRENQLIADSLAGQLQSLAAEWTALWSAIGDTGVIDSMSQQLSQLTRQIDEITGALNKNRQNIGANPVQDRNLREDLAFLTGGHEGFFRTARRDYTPTELGQAQKIAMEIKRMIDSGETGFAGKDVMVDGKNVGMIQKILGRHYFRGGSTFDGIRSFDSADLDSIAAAIDKQQTTNAIDTLSALRERAAAVPRLLESLARVRAEIERGGDPIAIGKDFEALAKSQRSLPGGGMTFAQNYTGTRSAIQSGDKSTALAGLDAFTANAKQHEASILEAFERARTAEVSRLEGLLGEAQSLESEIAASFSDAEPGTAKWDELTDKLEDAQKETKALSDSLQSAKQDANELASQAVKSFAPLEQWFASLRGEMETLNQLREKILGGEVAPISRQIMVGQTNARSTLDALNSLRFDESSRLADLQKKRDSGATDLDDEIAKRDEILSRIDTEILAEQKAVDAAEKKLAILERTLHIQEAISAGAEIARNFTARLGIGLTDTDRNIATFRGIAGEGNSIATTGPHIPLGTESQGALGQLLEYEKSMRAIIASMTGRSNTLHTDLANLPLQSAKDLEAIRQGDSDERARRMAGMRVRLDGIRSLDPNANQTDQQFSELQRHLSRMQEIENSPSSGDRAQETERIAEYAERRQKAEELAYSLMDREASLLQERAGLEREITEEQRNQTDEAAKRLLMADREDQLRAAALARTLRDTGPISQDEFFYLSPETRQTAANYLPGQFPFLQQDQGSGRNKPDSRPGEIDAELNRLRSILPDLSRTLESLNSTPPDSLNESIAELNRDLATKREELTGELDQITKSLPSFRAELENFANKITELTSPGGAFALPQTPLETPPDLATMQPQVNVNIDAITVSVEVTKEVESLTRSYIKREMAAMEKRLAKVFAPSTSPDTTGAGSASF